jgi:hypothetical protein
MRSRTAASQGPTPSSRVRVFTPVIRAVAVAAESATCVLVE